MVALEPLNGIGAQAASFLNKAPHALQPPMPTCSRLSILWNLMTAHCAFGSAAQSASNANQPRPQVAGADHQRRGLLKSALDADAASDVADAFSVSLLILMLGGKKNRSFLKTAGTTSGLFARKPNRQQIATMMKRSGSPTNTSAAQCARDNARSNPGKAPKTKKMYTSGNQRRSAAKLPRPLAMPSGIARMHGIGNHMRVPKRLKNRWANATARPVGMLLLASAARMPVTVVPMFAPTVKGNILSSLMRPMPTKGVRVEVVMLLDWNRIVTPAPNKRSM
mmetsp:Transcript_67405/g.130266  ORF Transcript_67405/g.130266 Transcript_67405/m.130266 type:complete len:280 (-) Transcript_67405:1037-1876(-)